MPNGPRISAVPAGTNTAILGTTKIRAKLDDRQQSIAYSTIELELVFITKGVRAHRRKSARRLSRSLASMMLSEST